MSILKGLKNIEKENLISFHVPGHKNGKLLEHLEFAKDIGPFDTTEIHGTDNLHDAESCIKKTHEMIAAYYGSIESFMLVNGSTAGIISMIYAAFNPGDKVIISRDAHKSIFTGLIVAQLEPVYVAPEIDPMSGLSMGVSKEAIAECYQKQSDIKGAVITYPSYHGICNNLREIEKIVHDKKGLLLVDGAHGAHLNLSESLPKTAISLGADIVVHSTHKSLPAFTQSSILHYCSNRVSLTRLKMALSMFQSSSPSYLLMASLENAVRVSKTEGFELMEGLLEHIRVFSDRLKAHSQFEVLTLDKKDSYLSLDQTKITVLTHKVPYSGGELDQLLRSKYGIQCEYGTDLGILFITSIGTYKEDLNRLLDALIEISQEIELTNDNEYNDKKQEEAFNFHYETFVLRQEIKPYQAMHAPKVLIDLQVSVGEIAGDFITPYPPGIPIMLPGEVISEQVVNYIEEGIRKGYNINGVYCNNKKLQLNIIRR